MKKKQSSIDWLEEQLKDVKYNRLEKNGYTNALNELYAQAKAMHKEEIVKAYNRDVINKKQNWFIENGERYYNLHYKEEQVGESGREIKSGKTNPNYKFEDGI